MKWFKNLFENNNDDDDIERDDFHSEEEWNAFASNKIDSSEEETVNVQRGFKFPMVSDEEFAKRIIVGTVSVYDALHSDELANTNLNINEPIHKQSVQPARERRRSRRLLQEADETTWNHSSERRTRRKVEESPLTFNPLLGRRTIARERVEDTPPSLVEQPRVSLRKPRQPEVITNPIPKSPFKLTEVPSPVFGFKQRNAESVNPNTIVEKYGKQDHEMDILNSLVARRNEQLREQSNTLSNSTIDTIDTVPKKVVNNHFEEDLSIISEKGFNSIEEVKLETTNLNEIVVTEQEKVLDQETANTRSWKEAKESVQEIHNSSEEKSEEKQAEVTNNTELEKKIETYIEEIEVIKTEEQEEVKAVAEQLEEVEAMELAIEEEQPKTKPVFEYCDDCDEEDEVEVFVMEEQEGLEEELEAEVEIVVEVKVEVNGHIVQAEEIEVIAEQPVEEIAEFEKQAIEEEQPETKPVFEYCDDCDEEDEVEVFGMEEQEVQEETIAEAEQLEEVEIDEHAVQAEETKVIAEQVEAPTVSESDEEMFEEEQQLQGDFMHVEEQLNLGKEEATATTVIENDMEEQVQQQEPVQPVSRRKIRPFNVLMTKYDKIRWEQQLEREKLAALAKETVVPAEASQEETVMEEDIHFYDEEIDQEIDNMEEVLDIDELEFEDDSFVDLEEDQEKAMTEEIIEETEEEPPFYAFPSMDLLNEPVVYEENEQWLNEREEMLNATFTSFNIGAKVVQRTQGPSVTRFEVQLDPGVKVNKITNLSDDIQLGLAARDIRIEAPIPGKHTVGIEVPNDSGRPVRISEIINTPEFKDSKSPLTSVLGLDIEGKPIVTDLKKMPHGLIAGATGSGKSVCINSILVSLLYKADPTDVKLILIDPKMVELAPYNNIPHLVSPVITDVKAATAALKWAVEEMERRYQLFAHTGVREIGRYNELVMESKKYNQKLPYIVVVIDELADLMMVAASDVEDAICRIAQKARACGIHLIIATQRPSVDVITGLIKANVPTRIAFSVSSQIDSRTIIDISGAEKLLGRGDMLFLENGSNKAVRMQGTYVTDEEIEAIVTHCKNERQVEYLFEQEDLLKKVEITEEEDELFLEACEFVVENQAASASMLQRRFKIGYNRAARLIDMMESYGYISENRGSKPREVLITLSDLDK